MVIICYDYWEELADNTLSLQRNRNEGSVDIVP